MLKAGVTTRGCKKWVDALNDLMTLLAAMPVDLHSHIHLTPVMRELIPLIEEDVL